MKKLLLALVLLVMPFSILACNSQASASKNIVIDEAAKTVTITANVNDAFFDKSTMHCVVFKDGKAAGAAMFAADVDSQDFHEALVKIGGNPWTVDKKLVDGEFTDGEKVNVRLTWEGQNTLVELSNILKTDSGRPNIDMRFSGNKGGNNETKSGCITCLNSCWAGICTNAAYAYGAIDSGNPNVYLDESVLNKNVKQVKIIYNFK